MDPIDELFNFVEGCEHAAVNLHPYFALMFIDMGIMAAFLHAVYCGNDFYAQVLLPIQKNSPVGVLTRGNLVASTSSSAPARKSSSATRTSATMTTATAAATRFLWTSFIDLKRATFKIQAIQFTNGPGSVIPLSEFDEAKTA